MDDAFMSRFFEDNIEDNVQIKVPVRNVHDMFWTFD